MQITKQINQNECGICVLHSMIDFYHKKDVPTHELITKSNLSSEGLSIYDLEIVGLNYGIIFDSYNATIEELKQISDKKYYVLILTTNNGSHYVIAKNNKPKNNVTIFCSSEGQYTLTWKQLASCWTGVYISCEKSIFNEVRHFQYKQFIQINWKYLLAMNCLSLINIGINIFCSTFIQKITVLLVEDFYVSISISLVFTYLIGYLSQYLINWFTERLCRNTVFLNYALLQYELWQKIQYKHRTFFNKINYKYLIDMDDYSLLLVDFYYSKLNQYIANAILLLTVVFILATIDLLILVFALGAILFSGLIDLATYKFQQENWNPSQDEQNNYKNSLINLVNFLKTNNNYSYEQKLSTQIKNNHYMIKQRFLKTNNFSLTITFVDSVIQIVFFIIICFFGTKLVLDEKINIGKLLFCISLTQMLSSSAKMLCVLPNSLVQFKHAKSVINNILNVDNLDVTTKLSSKLEVTSITYKNTVFNNDTILIGRSGVGKTYCLMQLANFFKSSELIKFNDLQKNEINDLWFKQNCIYLNQIPQLDTNMPVELFNLKYEKLTFECLNLAQIKNHNLEQLSTGQKQILCLLNLLLEKNKIILLDESLSNVNEELKAKILTLIKPIIIKDNFLIYVDHNSQCQKYFDHVVNFDE